MGSGGRSVPARLKKAVVRQSGRLRGMRFDGRGAHWVAEAILRSIAEGIRGIISDRLDFGVNQESVSGVLSGKRQFPSAAVHSRRDDDLRRESVLKLEVGGAV